MPDTDLDISLSALADDIAAGVSVPPVDRVVRRARVRSGTRVAGTGLLALALIGGGVGVAALGGHDGSGGPAITAATDTGPDVVTAVPPIPQTPALTITEREQDDQNAHLSWDEVALAPNELSSGVSQRIDSDLKAMVVSGLAAFRAENGGELLPGERQHAYITKTSALPSLPGLLVVRTDISVYTGGAHPNPVVEVRTYDLTTGARVEPDRLVRTDALVELQSTAIDRLEAYAAANEATLVDDMLRDGTAPITENYQTMWPAADGLHVVFGAYQVAPYAFGQPEIVIPWSIAAEWLPAGSSLHLP